MNLPKKGLTAPLLMCFLMIFSTYSYGQTNSREKTQRQTTATSKSNLKHYKRGTALYKFSKTIDEHYKGKHYTEITISKKTKGKLDLMKGNTLVKKPSGEVVNVDWVVLADSRGGLSGLYLGLPQQKETKTLALTEDEKNDQIDRCLKDKNYDCIDNVLKVLIFDCLSASNFEECEKHCWFQDGGDPCPYENKEKN